jgi:lysophospholipase L1-like esterase
MRKPTVSFVHLLSVVSILLGTETAAVAFDDALVNSQCEETPITASTAGDSITNAYWIDFRDFSSPPIWDVSKVAQGGIRAPQFNGEIEKDGVLHDYTQDLIDINPAIAVLLLGTNDSLVDWTNPDHLPAFGVYIDSVESILDRLEAAEITVIMGLPTPLQPITDYLATGEDRLANYYRPWIESEAAARELPVVDFFDLFVSQPGWEVLFPDGVHPFTEDGAHMMATEAATAICYQVVPEPSGALSLAVGALGLAGLAAHRDKRSGSHDFSATTRA